MMSYDYTHAVSRTYQYKKITKPLLERKRRARINRCLDELKDLMVDALETEGENISKLEKADILELTVRHLQRLQAARPSGLSSSITADDAVAENRWQSGFGHCAAEACRFLSALPGEAAERLARHLAAGLQTNRPSSTSPKPNLLSPTLASLERTANLVAPCSSGSSKDDVTTTVSGTVPCRQPSPKITLDPKTSDEVVKPEVHTESIEDIQDTSTINQDKKQTVVVKVSTTRDRPSTEKRRSNDSQNISIDEEEEIDVERVDDGDPMWRPW